MTLTPHTIPAFWEEAEQKDGGFRDNKDAFVVPTCPPPLPQRKPYKYKQSHEFWYCICLSPAQTMLSQPCWRMESKRILKLINYYFRLCRNKESGDHSLVLLLLSYINWNVMFICLFVLIETGFSIQWPNTYLLILSDLLSCKISFIKTVVTWWKQWINL